MLLAKLVYTSKNTSKIIFQQNSCNLEIFANHGLQILCKTYLFLTKCNFNQNLFQLFDHVYSTRHLKAPPHSSNKKKQIRVYVWHFKILCFSKKAHLSLLWACCTPLIFGITKRGWIKKPLIVCSVVFGQQFFIYR